MANDNCTGIPRRIIQTHKDHLIHKKHRQTWLEFHPDYEYQFFDDTACYHFFRDEFPDLAENYEKLPLAAQKADLFRYAYIYKHGGIYSDTDTICHAPVDDYIDLNINQLVVGLEMTPTIFPNPIHYYAQDYHCPLQILQWTFASPPGHPALKETLDRIVFAMGYFTRTELESYSQCADFTLGLTGPAVFTSSILGHLAGSERAGIRLLDQQVWGFNSHHQSRESTSQHPGGAIKVEHLFEGSWRTPRPRLWQRIISRL